MHKGTENNPKKVEAKRETLMLNRIHVRGSAVSKRDAFALISVIRWHPENCAKQQEANCN